MKPAIHFFHNKINCERQKNSLWIHFFILTSNISWFNLFGFIANLADKLDFHMAFMDILLHLYFSTSKWFLKFWISNPKNSHSFFFDHQYIWFFQRFWKILFWCTVKWLFRAIYSCNVLLHLYTIFLFWLLNT